MDIVTVRDLVISILFGLTIVIALGLMVGLLVIYHKVNKLAASIDNALRPVNRWLFRIHGFAQGLNESVNTIKKEGGRV